MNIASKIYCRIFQGAFRTALPVLPYREPEIISSCSKLDIVFKKEKVSSVLVVTDKGISANGLTAAVEQILKKKNIPYVIYDEKLNL